MLRTATAVGLSLLLTLGTAQAQTLRFGLAEDPDALDPTMGRTFVGRIVFSAMCDKLVDITPDLKVVPQLATEWTWSDDGKVLTMKLRTNVVFHDGEKFDAAAAKFSLERHLTMAGSQRRGEISAIKQIDAVDDLTIRMTLAAPFAPLMAQLTDRAGMMVSPKAAQALGDKFATAPVCAGPFKFVERVAQDRIVVEKFEQYWNKDAIKLKRIEFRPFTDNAVKLANLKAGQLDIIERLAATDVAEVKKDPKLKFASIVELGYQGITINTNNGDKAKSPIGQSEKVREAFELALDRQAIVQVVFNGEYQAGNQWLSPSNPNYDKAFPIPKRDVAKARALLKEAGVANPVVNLMTPTTGEQQQLAQVIQAMTKEAGFDVRIQATEFASSLNLAEKGDFEAYLLAWSGRTDPDGNLYNFVACKGPLNYGKYCKPEVDALLDQSRTTTDIEARRKAWNGVAKATLADRPVVYLYHRKWLWAATAKLSGFTEYPDGLVRFANMTLN
ncbi:MAG: ABC transporter substrate-binding protein [Ferrovibrionaceae bacterium]